MEWWTTLIVALAGGALGAIGTYLVSSKELRLRQRTETIDRFMKVAAIAHGNQDGKRVHPDLPELEYVEVATEPVVWQQLDAGQIDLAILDGEATPAGGMGVARQMKDEVYQAPPALVLTGRPQDNWLATWSRADAAVSHPLDPIELAEAVVRLLRSRVPAQVSAEA